jgi:type I restriction enzyme S subunit
MNEKLPTGWDYTYLKNICIIETGKKDVNEENPDGKYNFFTCAKEIHKIDKYVFKGDSILIAGNGFFNVKHFSGKFDAYQRTYVLQNFKVNYIYLYWYIKFRLDVITKDHRGSTIKYIRLGDLADHQVFIPPINEQKRIVAKLDAIMPRIDSVKERLEKIPLIIKRFRQSVLTAAVTGNLTEEWREKHPDVESADDLLERIKDFKINNVKSNRELNSIKKNYKEGFERLKNIETPFSIPDKWRYCEINSIGNVYNGSTPSRKEPEYWNGDINWISSGEVANLRIKSTREQITHEGFKNSSVRLFPKGTVLIAMIGEGKTRGQTAILDIESTCNQNIAAIIIDHGLVLPEYLYNWLFMQYEHNRNFGSGSGPKALNCQRVREIDFVLPPLEEQKQIVKEVNKLFALAEKVEIHHQQAKERVDKLSQSILAKAFRGELVPQDPNDEPAEVLLEKIIEEKTKIEKQLKSSKTASRKKREINK